MNTNVVDQYSLKGKIVVITGGAGFLGRHYADAIIEMNGTPVIVDCDEQTLTEAKGQLSKRWGGEIHALLADITLADDCAKVVDQIMATHGKIDVLINNAALAAKGLSEAGRNYFADFEDYEQDLWEHSLKVNLTGTFLITQAVGKIMRSQKSGVVINIASDVGVVSPDQRIYEPDESVGYPGTPFNTPASYAVTKAGIIHFTKYLATYWAPYNIRVNSFSPAGVYRGHDEGFVKKLSSRIPLGRMANPEEYKGPIVFLASDASSFMTGANLIVDGGRTCW